MNILDRMNRYALEYLNPGEIKREAVPESAVGQMIAELIEARASSFTITGALKLPAVSRGLSILSSTAASFPLVAYQNGVSMLEQPRLVSRPSPWSDRHTFVSQIVRDLSIYGNSYLKVGRDNEGKTLWVTVLPFDQIDVSWDQAQIRKVYKWRGTLVPSDQIVHIAINMSAGSLTGLGPIANSLDSLSTVDLAERYARGVFGSSGVPPLILNVKGQLTAAEAQALKAQWIASRSSYGSDAAVFSENISAQFPSVDPESTQMHQSLAYGAVVVAQLLGIPPALMAAEVGGAGITYQNIDALMSAVTKQTVLPLYLNPIEAAMTELAPRGTEVRFELSEMQRADFSTRVANYEKLISAGIMDAAEARRLEGWPVTETDQQPDLDADTDPVEAEE